MKRAGIQVRNASLPDKRDRLAQDLGQRGVHVGIVAEDRAAVGEGDLWNPSLVPRAEAEQPVDLAKATRCLSASELAIGIAHRKETVAHSATGIDVERRAFLAKH